MRKRTSHGPPNIREGTKREVGPSRGQLQGERSKLERTAKSHKKKMGRHDTSPGDEFRRGKARSNLTRSRRTGKKREKGQTGRSSGGRRSGNGGDDHVVKRGRGGKEMASVCCRPLTIWRQLRQHRGTPSPNQKGKKAGKYPGFGGQNSPEMQTAC